MSEDAGERWYQLIQADGDLTMIVRALHDRGSNLRTMAKSRQWAGPDCAKARQMMRDEADQCSRIAARAAGMTVTA